MGGLFGTIQIGPKCIYRCPHKRETERALTTKGMEVPKLLSWH